jgi:hypothetical protein
MQMQEKILNEVRAAQIDSRLIDVRTRQCQAVKTQNYPAMAFAQERVQSYLEQYQALTNHQYRLPNCGEL